MKLRSSFPSLISLLAVMLLLKDSTVYATEGKGKENHNGNSRYLVGYKVMQREGLYHPGNNHPFLPAATAFPSPTYVDSTTDSVPTYPGPTTYQPTPTYSTPTYPVDDATYPPAFYNPPQPTSPPVYQSSAPPYTPPIVPTSYPAHKQEPTPKPTPLPTQSPTTNKPTYESTKFPTLPPTMLPTRPAPSAHPSAVPSLSPTIQPSFDPSSSPSLEPSVKPSTEPSQKPSTEPSVEPSQAPSTEPSTEPSIEPSLEQSVSPSTFPTLVVPTVSAAPSFSPSSLPTESSEPTLSQSPTVEPTANQEPSEIPTENPEPTISEQPSDKPSESFEPSSSPTISSQPTVSLQPSIAPSISQQPSFSPTRTFQPSSSPSLSLKPSVTPTVLIDLNFMVSYRISVVEFTDQDIEELVSLTDRYLMGSYGVLYNLDDDVDFLAVKTVFVTLDFDPPQGGQEVIDVGVVYSSRFEFGASDIIPTEMDLFGHTTFFLKLPFYNRGLETLAPNPFSTTWNITVSEAPQGVKQSPDEERDNQLEGSQEEDDEDGSQSRVDLFEHSQIPSDVPSLTPSEQL
ncbi:PT repeat/fibro-slime domain containing protein [Nitzschia inconspicua]|uniref:Circumsporozoite protein n=1 Tax=Nitzschia inconspicua TaxID=303405 RepID=A0A9K3LNJ0_9STRA|nr:PT repeat/fibro-slime domain containing protein [Nitzschia inconspicua]